MIFSLLTSPLFSTLLTNWRSSYRILPSHTASEQGDHISRTAEEAAWGCPWWFYLMMSPGRQPRWRMVYRGYPPEVTSCIFRNLSLASFQGRVVLKLCPSLFALRHPVTTDIISREERWRSQASCPDPVLPPQF